jgi:isopentenyl-diphosphate Delta-isomerase
MNESIETARRRKEEHLRLAAEEPSVQRPGRTHGLHDYDFEMLSLPELDLDAVDTRVNLLGVELAAPLLVGAMTGGSTEAGAVNRILAAAAERAHVGFCLGSQRPMIGGDAEAIRSFALRDVAPTTLIAGNLGAIQLRDAREGVLDELAETIGANAMYIHLNPLQEAVQPEGDRDWRGIYSAIARAASESTVPVLVKEVGAGLSPATLAALSQTGIAGVETAGVGGTSWRAFPGRIVIGSGGLRDGLEAAKCIALGADAVAMAWPFLIAARSHRDPERAIEAVVIEIQGVIETLRTTMFLMGAPSVSHLAATPMQVSR